MQLSIQMQSLNQIMKYPLYLLAFLLLLPLSHSQLFDITQTDKHGDILKNAMCNALTVIDFSFSSSTTLACSTSCTITQPQLSTLRYLDILGNENTYTLTNAQFITQTFLTGSTQAFVFQYTYASQNVYVAIPITTTNSSDQIINQQIFTLSNNTDGNLAAFASVTTSTLSSGIPLSNFNFLNSVDQGRFYEVMNTNTYTTLLVTKSRFIMPNALANANPTPLISSDFSSYYASTADVLCWGSVNTTGFFQTHMRESVPLWFFVIMILLFWFYNLISNENTSEVFQTYFKNNKWTSWSLYSIYYLAHQQFFTKTARTALVLINMLWQAMVVTGIFTTQGMNYNGTIIIWGTVVTLAASLPVPYIYGNLVLQKLYSTEKERFRIQIQMQSRPDKSRHEELELEQVHHQQHLYALYYGYYSSIILMLAVFAALCVHYMQVFPRNYYYLHWYWLATLGATIIIDHLVIDPIMTLLFGNSNFYKSRGYYYDSQLGQLERQLL